jgi:transcriptional regulator with PAS, ATPase and Fis domain
MTPEIDFGNSCHLEIRKINELAKRIAVSDIPVFIIGETGVGKDVLANAIHQYSHRASNKIVSINCAAIPETLFESELFGNIKGAFTGSTEKRGLLSVANDGTLFLDEVVDLSTASQAKILTVLETKKYRRVGSIIEQNSDFRIISATNGNPGKLREDLRYRLCGIVFTIPPLRKRQNDIVNLANFFLNKFRCKKELTLEANELLCNYCWPGNIRELKYVIQRASLLSNGETITHFDIIFDVFETSVVMGESRSVTPLRDLEIHEIQKALIVARGLQKSAAKLLGISERSLCYKIQYLNLRGWYAKKTNNLGKSYE